MKITNKKILVTGGASGIGLAMAERFLRDGNTVLICGRRESALAEAKNKIPALLTKACDLSQPAGRESLFQWIREEHPDLQVLVNNAGIQNWMGLEDEKFAERMHDEIAINVEAPLHLAHLFIKLPQAETIMNVTSGLAFAPLTKVPVYSATKAFLRSFTLSLRYLLRDKNISVIEIIPPALNTDLGGKGIHDFAPPVEGFIDSIFNQLEEGRRELTYQFTENMLQAGSRELQQQFERMNPSKN